MSEARTIGVASEESEWRIDRWLRRRFPQVPLALIQKWLRTGQVRVDGKRVKAGTRLEAGQAVRVPPQASSVTRSGAAPGPPAPRPVSDRDAAELRSRLLYRDAKVIAIDKPAGLAVQGGTGTRRHLDGMLDALRFDAPERPRLVHRLDKDTSGVLLLARSARAAAELSRAFQSKQARKLYWAIVVGQPDPDRGRISAPLAKVAGQRGERVEEDERTGRSAVTYYRTVDRASRKAAWLALEPGTGRTHQLRVHCASVLGTPILGDGKYGQLDAFLPGGGAEQGLHLHARAIRIPMADGGVLEVVAPPPPNMVKTMAFLGFDTGAKDVEFDEDSD